MKLFGTFLGYKRNFFIQYSFKNINFFNSSEYLLYKFKYESKNCIKYKNRKNR